MVGIPVLEVECAYLSFIRVSSQVVGRIVWDETGQGITEGLVTPPTSQKTGNNVYSYKGRISKTIHQFFQRLSIF